MDSVKRVVVADVHVIVAVSRIAAITPNRIQRAFKYPNRTPVLMLPKSSGPYSSLCKCRCHM